MKNNNLSMYLIKYASVINQEIERARVKLKGDAEQAVYREFQNAVQDYLTGDVKCTDEEFVGFFHKYVGFAIAGYNAITTVGVTDKKVELEKKEETPSKPWYEDVKSL